MSRPLCLLLTLFFGLWPGAAQVATETGLKAAAVYPADWPPGPARHSVPGWAAPGRIRFSRWDGGPIETAKAFLSGWPGFNPPIPDFVYAMTKWYDPHTIAWLRQGGINLIWVTFSNGFSIPAERGQREMLARYIDECHRQGIRVMAYHSVANMFWEDMFEKVPESKDWIETKDGRPVPYGAGDYTRMGRVTRYMAKLSHPGWRDYLKQRIDLAIDAGADGIMYDNCYGDSLFDTFREIYSHAASRKRDFLIMANFHKREFTFNRLINALTTEEGGEAGLFAESKVRGTKNRWMRELNTMLPVEGGYLANNIGRFRMFQNLSESFKPVMIESRLREEGVAETHVMTGPRHQVVMAENMMFNAANELFVEGVFAHGLWFEKPETMEVWRAIGQYNRFQADHEELYVGGKPMASLAVVLDNRSEGEEVLNGLAGRNVMFDVLYEHELTAEKLAPYAATLAFSARMVRNRALAALETYVSGGGKLFAAGDAASLDERGRGRTPPAFLQKNYWEKLPGIDELARALKAADRPAPVKVDAPPGVLYNPVALPDRLVVHLVNYVPKPAPNVRVAARGNYRAVRLYSPDTPREPLRITSMNEVQVPALKIYSVVVFEKARAR